MSRQLILQQIAQQVVSQRRTAVGNPYCLFLVHNWHLFYLKIPGNRQTRLCRRHNLAQIDAITIYSPNKISSIWQADFDTDVPGP